MKREPVLIAALCRVVIAAAAHFGFEVSTQDLLTLMGAVEVVAAILTRRKTVPASEVEFDFEPETEDLL